MLLNNLCAIFYNPIYVSDLRREEIEREYNLSKHDKIYGTSPKEEKKFSGNRGGEGGEREMNSIDRRV